MGFFDDVTGHIKTLASSIGMLLTAPPEIEVEYPKGTMYGGQSAGKFLLKGTAEGQEYEWNPAPLAPSSVPEVRSANVIEHRFDDLASFHMYASSDQAVFVRCKPGEAAHVVGIDDMHPEDGAIIFDALRHPRYLHWATVLGGHKVAELTHVAFADLLLDNQDDMDEPAIASYFAQFRGAKTVEYAADLDDSQTMGVKVAWAGRTASDPKTADAKVPREFSVTVPAYVGVWPPTKEVRHQMLFRVRVIAPKGEGAAPLFRVTWTNAAEFELEAAQAVQTEIVQQFEGGEIPVFLGSPHAKHFIVPEVE